MLGFDRLMAMPCVRAWCDADRKRDDVLVIVFTPNAERKVLAMKGHYSIEALPRTLRMPAFEKAYAFLGPGIGVYTIDALLEYIERLQKIGGRYEIVVHRDERMAQRTLS